MSGGGLISACARYPAPALCWEGGAWDAALEVAKVLSGPKRAWKLVVLLGESLLGLPWTC